MSSAATDLLQLELDSAKAEHDRAEAEARFRRLLLEQARSQAADGLPTLRLAHRAGSATSLASQSSAVSALRVQPSACAAAARSTPPSVSSSETEHLAMMPVMARAMLLRPSHPQSTSAAVHAANPSAYRSPSVAGRAMQYAPGGPAFASSAALLDLASAALPHTLRLTSTASVSEIVDPLAPMSADDEAEPVPGPPRRPRTCRTQKLSALHSQQEGGSKKRRTRLETARGD
jgi:hypothetical protein